MNKIYEDLEFYKRINEVFHKYLGYKKQNELVKKYKSEYNATTINKYFISQKTITKKLIKLLYSENINIDWICTGRDNPLISKEIVDNHFYNESVNIHERMNKAIQNLMKSPAELSSEYDFLSAALISNFCNINTTITKDIAKLCFYENINIDWVCTGRGEIFINNEKNIENNENLINTLLDHNNLENKTLELLKQLSQEQKEYYFHKISADIYENKHKK